MDVPILELSARFNIIYNIVVYSIPRGNLTLLHPFIYLPRINNNTLYIIIINSSLTCSDDTRSVRSGITADGVLCQPPILASHVIPRGVRTSPVIAVGTTTASDVFDDRGRSRPTFRRRGIFGRGGPVCGFGDPTYHGHCVIVSRLPFERCSCAGDIIRTSSL